MFSLLKRLFASQPTEPPQRPRVMAISVGSDSALRRLANNDAALDRALDELGVHDFLQLRGLTIENRTPKRIGGLAGFFDSEMGKHMARSNTPKYLGRDDD